MDIFEALNDARCECGNSHCVPVFAASVNRNCSDNIMFPLEILVRPYYDLVYSMGVGDLSPPPELGCALGQETLVQLERQET